jgi:hypothetical protein
LSAFWIGSHCAVWASLMHTSKWNCSSGVVLFRYLICILGTPSNKTDDYPYSWSQPPYRPSTMAYKKVALSSLFLMCSITRFLKSKSGVVVPGQPGPQILLAHQKYWLPITNGSNHLECILCFLF